MSTINTISSKKLLFIVAALLVLNIAFRAAVLLQPLEHIDSIAMPDDTYLLLSLARSIAHGDGPVYSGAFTNGFQPLYVYLLAPVYLLVPDNDITPIYINLVLLILFDTLALFLLFRLVHSISRSILTPVIVAAAWIVNPLSITTAVNGLETSAASFFIVAMLLLYKKYVYDSVEISNSQSVLLGALFGLGILTRIDTVFLAGALTMLVLWKHRTSIPSALKFGILIATGITMTYGPWLLYSWIKSGDLFPVSGKAIRFLELDRAEISFAGTDWYWHTMTTAIQAVFENNKATLILAGTSFFASMVTASPFTNRLRLRGKTFTAMYLIAGSLAVIHLMITIYFYFTDGWFDPVAFITLLLSGALLVPVVRSGSALCSVVRTRSLLIVPLLLFAVLLFFGYTTYIYGVWFFPRYFFPVNIVILILSGIIIDVLLAAIPSCTGQLKIAGPAIVLIVGVNIVLQDLPRLYQPNIVGNGYLSIGLWAQRTFPQGTVIGSCQSGALGYFARQCTVINLDGVVNKKCYEALVQRKSLEYIRTANIRYVIGWPLNTAYLERCSTEPLMQGLIEKGPIENIFSWRSGWELFEVKQRLGADARSTGASP